MKKKLEIGDSFTGSLDISVSTYGDAPKLKQAFREAQSTARDKIVTLTGINPWNLQINKLTLSSPKITSTYSSEDEWVYEYSFEVSYDVEVE